MSERQSKMLRKFALKTFDTIQRAKGREGGNVSMRQYRRRLKQEWRGMSAKARGHFRVEFQQREREETARREAAARALEAAKKVKAAPKPKKAEPKVKVMPKVKIGFGKKKKQ